MRYPSDANFGSLRTVPNLMLTADDLGRSAQINAAIGEWARAGALTQASLMVHEPAAAEAVTTFQRDFPAVRLGLHLTLCDGLDSTGQPLPRTPAGAGLSYAFWPAARVRLRQEIASQFERFRALGLPPAYWDGHTHLHLHPTVMAIALPIAKAHGFTFTRLVREPGPPALLPWIFQRLSARAIPRLNAAGIGFADFVFGLRRTGRMRPDDFRAALKWADTHTIEIYFHPGAETELPPPEWVAREIAAR